VLSVFFANEFLCERDTMRHDDLTVLKHTTGASSLPSPLFACLRTPRMPDVAIAVAKDFSPRVQRYGSGCVVLDVGGLGRLLGEPQAIGAELARACTGRYEDRGPRQSASRANLLDPRRSASRDADPRSACRVAVAPTQMGVLLLSLAHQALTVVPDDVGSALANVSIQVLHQLLAEIHGVTILHTKPHKGTTRHAALWASYEKLFGILQRWGITTLGEFTALPAGELSARLGQDGIALQQCARGVDPRPLVPDPDVPRFLERVELEWPIDGLEPLSFVLARMLEPLSSALERADRGAAAIHVNLRLVDRTTHARVLQLPAAMRDPRVLRTLLVLDLESHPPPAAIDTVTIEIDPAPGRVLQYSLLERARPSAETLATLTARLGALVGESRCGAPALLDSHQPDAFEMRRFAPDAHTPQSVLPNPPSAIGTGQAATRLRPLGFGEVSPERFARRRIGSRQSAVGSGVWRRFRPPIAIRVSVERGRPMRVAIDRRGMPGGHVEQCAGPWRSSGGWWDRAARQWNRDEWDVALSDGSVCRLFRERDTGRWFMDGVVD